MLAVQLLLGLLAAASAASGGPMEFSSRDTIVQLEERARGQPSPKEYAAWLLQEASALHRAADDESYHMLSALNDNGQYDVVSDLVLLASLIGGMEAEGATEANAGRYLRSVERVVPLARATEQGRLGNEYVAVGALSLLSYLIEDPNHSVGVEFAVCKAWSALGQHDLAWRHCTAGNAAVAALVDRPYLAQMIHLMDVISGSRPFAGMPPVPVTEPLEFVPVFVIGQPRTGSSLLEQMLSMVPGVTPGGELSLFYDVVLVDAGRLLEEAYGTARVSPDLSFRPMCQPHVAARYRQELIAAMRARLQPGGGSALVIKTLVTAKYAPYIARLLPEARFLHTARDRRDVTASLWQLWFDNWTDTMAYAFSPQDIEEHLDAHERLERSLYEDAYLRERLRPVRFDRFVQQPEPEMRGVLDFLGLPWTPAVFDFYRGARGPPGTASDDQVRRPINTKGVGRWRQWAEFMPVFGLPTSEEPYVTSLPEAEGGSPLGRSPTESPRVEL